MEREQMGSLKELSRETVEKALEKIKSNPEFAVDGCHYELVREDRYKDMLDFYWQHFCPYEPVNRSLQVPWDDEFMAAFNGALKHNLSLALVSTENGEIVAGRLIIIPNKDEHIDTSKFKSEPLRKLFDAFIYLSSFCDLYDYYKTDEMVHFYGLGVHENYRKKGIATKVQKAAIAFAQSFVAGPVVIRGEGSSNYSQRIYEKLGFKCHVEIAYTDYKVNGEVVIKNTGDHKSYKLYGKVF